MVKFKILKIYDSGKTDVLAEGFLPYIEGAYATFLLKKYAEDQKNELGLERSRVELHVYA